MTSTTSCTPPADPARLQKWIHEDLVDYVCPSLFLATLPGMPLTREFVALAGGTPIGVYPTLWPLGAWQHGVCELPVSLEAKESSSNPGIRRLEPERGTADTSNERH